MSIGSGMAAMRRRLWRLAGLLLCAGLLVSMTSGAIVHAAEALCADAAVSSVIADDAERPPFPSGDTSADKAMHYAHACHGHHAAVAEVAAGSAAFGYLRDRDGAAAPSPLADIGGARLLRPPIA